MIVVTIKAPAGFMAKAEGGLTKLGTNVATEGVDDIAALGFSGELVAATGAAI